MFDVISLFNSVLMYSPVSQQFQFALRAASSICCRYVQATNPMSFHRENSEEFCRFSSPPQYYIVEAA